MITSTTPLNTWTKAAHVIVDWSKKHEEVLDEAVALDDLMRWIKTYPERERAALHVYLRRTVLQAKNLQLQRWLQSLGCRVTMRSRQVVTA